MATDLGKVGMVMKGAYNSANTYEAMDVVTYNSATYIAKQAVPVNTVPTNTTYWQAALTQDFSLYSRNRNNITSRLSNLITAVSEQNLEKYSYKIGDYFTGASGYTYHLADMNTFYGGYNSYAVVNTPHIALVVNTNANSQWYTGSDITGVSYTNSTLHQYLAGDVLNNIKADMIALFGGTTGLEHLVSHTLMDNSLGSWGWASGNDYIAALTELQMYGSMVGSADEYQQGEGYKQLELFRKYSPNLIYLWNFAWLRSIASSGDACRLHHGGLAGSGGVTSSALASGLILFH